MKKLALAVLLLLLAVPVSAQYEGGVDTTVDGDLTVTGDLTVVGSSTGGTSGTVTLPDGTTTLPSLTFESDTGSGLSYTAGTDEVRLQSGPSSADRGYLSLYSTGGEPYVVLYARDDSNAFTGLTMSQADETIYFKSASANSASLSGALFDVDATSVDIDGDSFTVDQTTASATDWSLSFTDATNTIWLTITDAVTPANVITFTQQAESAPKHIIDVVDGTGGSAFSQAVDGINNGFMNFTVDDGTVISSLNIDSDGTGLEWNMSGATATTVDFDLSDVQNDTWLTFTDVEVATNVVSYEQRAASSPGYVHTASNATGSVTHEVEVGATPYSSITSYDGTYSVVDSVRSKYFEKTIQSISQRRYQGTKAFTDGVPVNIIQLPITNGAAVMGSFEYSALESGGGIIVANSGLAQFACVNEADGEECTITMQATEASAVDGDSGSTMVCTPAVAGVASNAVMVSMDCNTSSAGGGNFWWTLKTHNDYSSTAVYQ